MKIKDLWISITISIQNTTLVQIKHENEVTKHNKVSIYRIMRKFKVLAVATKLSKTRKDEEYFAALWSSPVPIIF